MKRGSKFLIVALSTFAMAGTAVAQGDGGDTGTGDGTGDAGTGDGTGDAGTGDGTGDAGTGDAGTGDAGTGDAAVPDDGAAVAGRWPSDVIARPLTYPKGILALGVDITNNVNNFFDPALIRPSVGYGITDDFEINFAAYSATTDAFGDGSIDGGFGYKLVRGGMGGKLEVIARAQAGYSLGASAANPIGLAAHVQYNVTPKVAIITGVPGTSHFVIGIDPSAISFELPIAIGLQPIPKLYLELDAKLAHVKISGDANANVFPGDSLPISLLAQYNAMPALDVILALGTDVTPIVGSASDFFTVTLGARYYIGKL